MIQYKSLEDVTSLLSKAKKIKNNPDAPLKIAVLGSYSIHFFVSVLRYMLFEEEIEANIYEGHYDGINTEALNSNSELYKFNPNITIILTYFNDVRQFPKLMEDEEGISNCTNITINYYKRVWSELSKIPSNFIFQSNFVIPNFKQLGNLEYACAYSKTNFYRRINDELVKTTPSNVKIIDMDSLASDIGKIQWFDYGSYFLNKSGFKLDFIGYVVYQFMQQIKAYIGKIKKCLVLDLDNTLWGGVVADEGYSNIMIDPNDPIGESYLFFQQYILELKERGIILAVCSKNDIEIAKEPFQHNEFMKLHLEDISCFVANWDDKTTNIKRIANELNIGTDSMVFFDDNPFEREIVREYLPEVQVIEVSKDSEEYVNNLVQEMPFEWLQITKEDLVRTQSYHENTKRNEMISSFENYEEYLYALEMKGSYSLVDKKRVERFTQLINKSNQFNLRTQRYSEDQIQNFTKSDIYKCINIEIQDRFSNYGIISSVILKKIDEKCFIDTWVMSCRVLKRDIEKFTFNAIVQYAAEMNCKYIIGEYIPTKKNQLVRNLYTELGFTQYGEKENIYIYRSLDKVNEKIPIKIISKIKE